MISARTFLRLQHQRSAVLLAAAKRTPEAASRTTISATAIVGTGTGTPICRNVSPTIAGGGFRLLDDGNRLARPPAPANFNNDNNRCCAGSIHQQQQQQQQHTRRTYVSRAHQPRPVPETAVHDAVVEILKDARRRIRRRERKWKRNQDRQQQQKKEEEEATAGGAEAGAADGEEEKEGSVSSASASGVKHPDETIELAIFLNLDPRKPGQALRGSVSLPHGTGKTSNRCIVFTNDEALQKAALEAGAAHAGGDELVDRILDGSVPLDGTISATLATNDVMPTLSKKVARLLGPRGLMPNAKVGTLVQPDQLLSALDTKIAGKEVTYRTEREGVVHVPVGKASFGPSKLLENIGEVMKEIYRVKPETYGKGKKSSSKSVGKGTKYLLRASITSTQGKGMRLEPRTVDPGSAFFLASAKGSATSDSSSSGKAGESAVAA